MSIGPIHRKRTCFLFSALEPSTQHARPKKRKTFHRLPYFISRNSSSPRQMIMSLFSPNLYIKFEYLQVFLASYVPFSASSTLKQVRALQKLQSKAWNRCGEIKIIFYRLLVAPQNSPSSYGKLFYHISNPVTVMFKYDLEKCTFLSWSFSPAFCLLIDTLVASTLVNIRSPHSSPRPYLSKKKGNMYTTSRILYANFNARYVAWE